MARRHEIWAAQADLQPVLHKSDRLLVGPKANTRYQKHHVLRQRFGKAVLVCACALLLAGCLSTTKPVAIQHYTLGAPPIAGDRTAAAHGKVLRLARISVPPWLAGTDMHYRLACRGDQRLASYAYSDWAAPPASMLQSVIRRALAAGDSWQAVVGPGNPARADASLRLKLTDFSQHFTAKQQSVGVIEVVATLVAHANGRVPGQKHFRVQVSAPTANAPGGAKALGQASRKLAKQLQRWLRAVAADSPGHGSA